ncbi:Myb-like DNA-binding domain containing protein [Histomonas meleagridis]|uniref:Myb-like DNA-binding domain containing protein n=1 Tax=Histomonas meleagridis TaxID=135588 RepID=UPI00355A4889|nr:Myb-like DNA-binding domain containing protein [Histomonas meleagridis]KAH0799451.1 Myb-like DNA-binding domain containing protein [Histomonas meleagridis]
MEITPYAEQIFRQYLSVEIDAMNNQIADDRKQNIISESISFILGEIDSVNVRDCVNDNINYFELIGEIKRVFKEVINHTYITTFSYQNFEEARPRRSPKWSKKEDIRLLCGTAKYGAKNWRAISDFVGHNRTSIQCNQRWNRSVNPEILHSEWTKEEDDILLETVNVKKITKWKQISNLIPGRTDLQCRYRYTQLTRNGGFPQTDQENQKSPQETPNKQIDIFSLLVNDESSSTNDEKHQQPPAYNKVVVKSKHRVIVAPNQLSSSENENLIDKINEPAQTNTQSEKN